jgi:hypothetical protein
MKRNLICVDWGKLSFPVGVTDPAASLLHYPQAVEYTMLVGKTVATFIRKLMKAGFLEGPGKVHLLGHSLGSHVSGVAGHEVLANTKSKVARITGKLIIAVNNSQHFGSLITTCVYGAGVEDLLSLILRLGANSQYHIISSISIKTLRASHYFSPKLIVGRRSEGFNSRLRFLVLGLQMHLKRSILIT